MSTARSRGWLVLAYVFVAAAIAVGIAAVGVLLTSLSDANASAVRTILVGVVPALAVLALSSFASFVGVSSRAWSTALMGLLGLGFATAAHQSWYDQVDREQPDAGRTAMLFGAAVLITGIACAAILTPSLRRTRLSTGAAISISVLVGVLAAGALVVSLATPFASLLLAITTLITIVMRSRSSIRGAAGAEPQGPDART